MYFGSISKNNFSFIGLSTKEYNIGMQLLIYILIFFIAAIIGIPTSFASLIPSVFALFQVKLSLTINSSTDVWGD